MVEATTVYSHRAASQIQGADWSHGPKADVAKVIPGLFTILKQGEDVSESTLGERVFYSRRLY